MISDEKIKELIEKAKKVKDTAYAPYSKYKVGAAVLCRDGSIFSGCNIENSSFGLTVCAERNAVANAILNNNHIFTAIAVISDGEDFCVPCGACRQVLYEFAPYIDVYCCNLKKEYKKYSLSELLPNAFRLEVKD